MSTSIPPTPPPPQPPALPLLPPLLSALRCSTPWSNSGHQFAFAWSQFHTLLIDVTLLSYFTILIILLYHRLHFSTPWRTTALWLIPALVVGVIFTASFLVSIHRSREWMQLSERKYQLLWTPANSSDTTTTPLPANTTTNPTEHGEL